MIIISLSLIVLCCVVIWRASDGFEVASEYLGRNLSDGVRGATINAIGSSMPELFTTLFFLFILNDKDGFAAGIGTTAGSAIFNGMIIPAVVILIVVFKGITKNIQVSRSVLLRDGIALIIAEFVLIFLVGGDSLNWIHGLLLMVVYFVYVVYMLSTMKGKTESEISEITEEIEEEVDAAENRSRGFFFDLLTLNLEAVAIKKELHTANSWGLLLLSMTIIGSACLLLVKSCEWLGEGFGVPVYFIAVILASAATSVPDTILSMKDAEKGNYDDAVSNALGSNIFDVCFALGFPLFLFTIINGPIYMSAETVTNVAELRILLLLLTIVAFVIYIIRTKLGIISAALLLSIYVLFSVFIFGKALNSDFALIISSYLDIINTFFNGFRFW